MKALSDKLNATDLKLDSKHVHQLKYQKWEFLIPSQIGEGGQRDELSYTNLLHHIDGRSLQRASRNRNN